MNHERAIREHRVISDSHDLRVLDVGDPTAIPVIYFQGGPGAPIDPNKANIFDPRYRVILFDQRGTGGSTPSVTDATSPGDLAHNTTVEVLKDALVIREALGIQTRMVVAGGSFGSMFALAYAMKHPDHVRGALVFEVLLGRDQDLRFFDPGSAGALVYKDAYDRFLQHLPQEQRANPLDAYETLFWDRDPEVRDSAAREWILWNQTLLYSTRKPDEVTTRQGLDRALAIGRLFCIYRKSGAFLKSLFASQSRDNDLLDNLDSLPNVPIEIVNGDQDLITPFENALLLDAELRKRAGNVRLSCVAGAAHSTSEPGYMPELQAASARLADSIAGG